MHSREHADARFQIPTIRNHAVPFGQSPTPSKLNDFHPYRWTEGPCVTRQLLTMSKQHRTGDRLP
jgi:hypothetical protein